MGIGRGFGREGSPLPKGRRVGSLIPEGSEENRPWPGGFRRRRKLS